MKTNITIILILLGIGVSVGCKQTPDTEKTRIGKSHAQEACGQFVGLWVNDDNPYYPFYLQIKKKDGKFVVKNIPRSDNLNGTRVYAAVCNENDALDISEALGGTITYFNEDGNETLLSGGTTFKRYTKKKQ